MDWDDAIDFDNVVDLADFVVENVQNEAMVDEVVVT
jgi:hypothetical protein